MSLAVHAAQVLGYLGAVAFGGLLLVWALLWPANVSPVRLRGAVLVTATVAAVGTAGAWGLARIARPLAVDGLDTAAALVRLGVLVAVVLIGTDLARPPVTTGRRALTVTAAVLVAITVVAQAAVIQRARWIQGTAWAGLHLVGASTLLGSLMILLAALGRRPGSRSGPGSAPGTRAILLARAGLSGAVGLVVIMVTSGTSWIVRLVRLAPGTPASMIAVLGICCLVAMIVLSVVTLARLRARRAELAGTHDQVAVVAGARAMLIMMLLLGGLSVITGRV